MLLGRQAGFFDWYKRRICRIYPTVFAITLVASMFCWGNWHNRSLLDVLLHGGGWFVSCIMIYYVIFWFIRSFWVNYLKYVFAVGIAAVILWYLTIGIDSDNNNMYHYCYFKWVHYFLFMLFGAIVGFKRNFSCVKNYCPPFLMTLFKLFVCVVAFYGLFWFKCKSGIYDLLQISSLIPLMGVTYYFYQLCNTKASQSLYRNEISGPIVRLIGGLCLEIYLIQGMIFSDVLNFMFPLNVPIFFVIIVAAAYMLRCFARIWSQTFKDADYDWKSVVKLY